MLVELIDEEKSPVSFSFLSEVLNFIEKELIKKKVLDKPSDKKIIITFISPDSIKDLNNTFLKKNSVTDVLSFAPMEKDYLGELAFCEEKIKSQSQEHNLTFNAETVYLFIHGILHLLGFHHEDGGEEARKMFEIQDSLFERWQGQFKKGE